MNIFESIAAIMQEGYAVSKDKENKPQGFKYRGIDDVMNTFYPLLAQHKVFVVPEVLEQTREERQTTKGGNLIYSILRLKYTFFAEDGSSVSAVVVGEGMDSGDKASNKAMAVGMKYALFQVFCIPTEEMTDPDATTPERSVPVPQKPRKVYSCSACGKPITDYIYNGKVRLSAEDIVTRSMDAFGRQLCMDCSRAARMEEAQALVDKADEDNGG